MLQFPAKVWTGLSEVKVKIEPREGATKRVKLLKKKPKQTGLFPTGHAGPICSSHCPDDLVLMFGPSAGSRDVWRRNALC